MPKLVNTEYLNELTQGSSERVAIANVLAQKFKLQVKNKSNVALVKDKVEQIIRKLLPAQVAVDVLELRLGERLSLPNTAELELMI